MRVPSRAAKALIAAEEAQLGALSAAERAFHEAEKLQLPLSGPKAQARMHSVSDWSTPKRRRKSAWC